MRKISGKKLLSTPFLLMFLALISLVLGVTGCGSLDKEPENVSTRPWNSPEGYDHGNLPSNLFR